MIIDVDLEENTDKKKIKFGISGFKDSRDIRLLTYNASFEDFLKNWLLKTPWKKFVLFSSIIISILSTSYFFFNNQIILYGDAESHLNIAKRVVHSLTPGLAQLGGIWLPLPHLVMVPFVSVDFLWRSGLAGSIVSGTSFVVSSYFLYRLAYLITKNKIASIVSFIVFALNPNILYMQSTPMTELPLIALFILSTYFFFKFLRNDRDLLSLIFAGAFGLAATLTRYDGWFLVCFEGIAIILYYIDKGWRANGQYILIYLKEKVFNLTYSSSSSVKTINKIKGKIEWVRILEGKFFLFATIAFAGILLWMLWDFLILGDPFYFSNSQFSARTQQQNWFARGELPAYKNIFLSFLYYFITSASNSGFIVFSVSAVGFFVYLFKEHKKEKFLFSLILLVPFIFYVITLYIGQSVIFIPQITPKSFEWTLFNVRYGMMMIPSVSIFLGYIFLKANKPTVKSFIIFLFVIQCLLYVIGYSKVLTLSDGIEGLSAAKRPDAELWMAKNYDYGLVLLDDYARTLSIIRSNLPMENIIYVGNKPYWDVSLKEPEKYATWIILQKDDAVWKAIYDDPVLRGRLFKYFKKAYTSPDILIFRRIT